jgi:hypothetical protein
MVHILPPPGWTFGQVNSAAVVSPTASVVAVAASPPEITFANVAPPSEEAAEAFAEVAALVGHPNTAADAPTNTAAEVAVAQTPVVVAGTKTAMWWGVGAATLLLGGLGFVALINMGASDDLAAEPASAQHVVAKPPSPIAQESTLPTLPAAAHEAETSAQTETVSTPQATGASDAHTADVATDRSEQLPDDDAADAENELPTQTEVAVRTASKSEPDASSAPDETLSEPKRESVLRFDPLDFDPSQLSLNGTTRATNAEVSNSVSAGVPDEPAGPATESHMEPDDIGLLGPPIDNASVTVRLGAIVPGDDDALTTARQFSLPVSSLNARDMPLDRFVSLVSGLSGLPITLDPFALELAGVTPQMTVAVEANDTHLEPLVRGLLTKNRLELEDRDGRLVIGLLNGSERSTKRYDVSDLLQPGAADASEIARTVESFVSPDAWRKGGGQIKVTGYTLTVDQTKAIHHELLIFCERWRLIRGLKARSRYPVSRLSTESPNLVIEDILKRSTTFTYLPWTRLDDLVRHWEQSAAVTILVDWNRLADVELVPSTPIACSAVDRPWGEALDEILEQLDLAWWAVDGRTIQVTTLGTLDDIQRTEFYRVPKNAREQFASPDVLVESLRTELREQVGNGATDQQRLRMQLDVPSSRLMVRGTPLVHRYLAQRLSRQADQ